VTLTEPALLDAPVSLRPIKVKDAAVWREARVRNASWLRPWEPTNPETPLYRSSLGPYVAMARTMRREARQGLALPWVVTYDGKFAGQLTIGSIVWGSARSAQVGYWIDEAFAGRGVIPTALALALDQCFFGVGLHRIDGHLAVAGRLRPGCSEHRSENSAAYPRRKLITPQRLPLCRGPGECRSRDTPGRMLVNTAAGLYRA
jgi:RimJ/RimL family protein N-acetyltransferase